MYVLDTNVLSELRKPPGVRNTRVEAWAYAQDAAALFISVVSLMEIRRGIYKLEQRGDAAQAVRLSDWLLRHVLPAFSDRAFNVDRTVALRTATLPWSTPTDYRDALIAATALVHGATVVTRNVKDFEATGVKLFNPWGADAG
jgi:predicted nucleic acid-binding protein